MVIDAMEAGRGMDRMVAEKVFEQNPLLARQGRRADGEPEYHWGYPLGHDIAPHYSTDIDAAWRVVNTLSQFTLTMLIGRWRAMCFDGINSHEAEAETAPLAICRVAIKAKGAPQW